MSVFRFLFVLMLCIPIGYLALRLIVMLIDQLMMTSKKRRRLRR